MTEGRPDFTPPPPLPIPATPAPMDPAATPVPEPAAAFDPADPYAPGAPNPFTASGPVMERPHPLTPVVKGWMGLVGLAIVFGRDFVEHLGDRSGPSSQYLGINIAFWFVGGGLLAYLLIMGVIGFFQWRTTRFVIDDQQVRIEHNFIWHNSDKIPFTKIQSVDVVQPFAARLLGLSQLRIDVGSGKPKTIEFLTRDRAYRLRDYLVQRAHGRTVTFAESSASGPVAGVLSDVSAHEDVLLTVPPQRLLQAAVLSMPFLVTFVLTLGTSIAMWYSGEWGVAAGLIPLATGLLGIISNQVFKQWNYQLVRSGQALKVTRGMTSLVSQTLPVDRIQGLVITQHLGWRPFGIFRVQMDVLGYGHGEDAKEAASDILLPAGNWSEVLLAVQSVWPGFDLDAVALQHVSPKARRLDPWQWEFMGWGRTEDVMVSRHGMFVRRTVVVHHARVQSAHLTQGPLERRLGLANVELNTTNALGNVHCVHLETDQARLLVLEEMDLCRDARRRDAERRALAALPVPTVPAQTFGIPAEDPASTPRQAEEGRVSESEEPDAPRRGPAAD